MTKSELIAEIAERTGLPKTDINAVLDALGDVAQSALCQGNEVPLPGLGKLKPTHRSARTGRNPTTGAAIEIPARRAVKFSASKPLDDALNN